MKMSELEVKIRLNSLEHLQQIFERCQQLFGPPTSHVMQLDEYFDTEDRQLKKQDLVIRIRSIEGQKIIALKSPRVQLPSGASERIELEFAAAEGEAVINQLKHQGLGVRQSSEKERWTFAHHEVEVMLDHLPFLGAFIEIEGPSENAIQEVLALLQLSSKAIERKNYGELMSEKLQELGISNMHATFSKEAQFQK